MRDPQRLISVCIALLIGALIYTSSRSQEHIIPRSYGIAGSNEQTAPRINHAQTAPAATATLNEHGSLAKNTPPSPPPEYEGSGVVPPGSQCLIRIRLGQRTSSYPNARFEPAPPGLDAAFIQNAIARAQQDITCVYFPNQPRRELSGRQVMIPVHEGDSPKDITEATNEIVRVVRLLANQGPQKTYDELRHEGYFTPEWMQYVNAFMANQVVFGEELGRADVYVGSWFHYIHTGKHDIDGGPDKQLEASIGIPGVLQYASPHSVTYAGPYFFRTVTNEGQIYRDRANMMFLLTSAHRFSNGWKVVSIHNRNAVDVTRWVEGAKASD